MRLCDRGVQFKSIPDEIIKKLEKKDVIQWERFFDMSPQVRAPLP